MRKRRSRRSTPNACVLVCQHRRLKQLAKDSMLGTEVVVVMLVAGGVVVLL